jgi:excisionase family DNA binding protein
MLRVADAADVLVVSESFVERQVARGLLPHVRLGRLVRIRRIDLDAYVDERRVCRDAE